MHRFMFMLGLIIAGEAVYALPFHVARFFRPTVLEVFSLSAIFGIRGLYYALFEEAKVPAAVTGTAVGFVSVFSSTAHQTLIRLLSQRSK